jgi:hypothetical protein
LNRRPAGLDAVVERFMAQHDGVFRLLAAALDELADQGASRGQAIACLLRWVKATAHDYQG